MTIPAARQRVQVEGQDGAFLVVWVDQESSTAQLIPLREGDELLSVPFSRIHPLDCDHTIGGTG